jgi:hypothetical protein
LSVAISSSVRFGFTPVAAQGRVPPAKAGTRSPSQRISLPATVERPVTVAQLTYRARELQRQVLAELGCDEMQGYLFAAPDTALAVSPVLLAHRPAAARVA